MSLLVQTEMCLALFLNIPIRLNTMDFVANTYTPGVYSRLHRFIPTNNNRKNGFKIITAGASNFLVFDYRLDYGYGLFHNQWLYS